MILRKGYDAITIQDLADEAETARVTFYRHYGDKEALLIDCLDVLYEELTKKIELQNTEGVHNPRPAVRIFYEHLEEQEDLYRILFSSRGTQTVVEHLRKYMATRVIQGINQHAPDTRPDIPIDIIAYHSASAQIGLGIWWLKNNKPYPVDYIAHIARWLSFAGVLRAFSIEADLPAPPPRPPPRT